MEDPRAALGEALAAVADTLRHHRDLGLREIALSRPEPPEAGQGLAAQERALQGCTRCKLSGSRSTVVFGSGNPDARLVVIGEGPGEEEDKQGKPFVGRAGQLLTAMIEKGMGLKREDVYICNVLKCRPPDNRTPATDEIAACKDYLLRQIEIVNPEVIIALGAPAAQTLLDTREGIGKLRARWHGFFISGISLDGEPIPVMPTYHPAYLLRDPSQKAKAWADLKMVMARLGIPVPQRS